MSGTVRRHLRLHGRFRIMLNVTEWLKSFGPVPPLAQLFS